MTAVTDIAYPPLQSQATTTFINDNVPEADRTGAIPDDFKKALANILSLDVNAYSIDDLWNFHIAANISGDSNAEPGNPAGRGARGGQHPRHFYSSRYLRNAGNSNAFPGSGGASGSDDDWASVSMLLALDGADAATSTTDTSILEHAITFNGNAQLDTAQFKYGTSSLLLDGTGDYLSAPDHSAFEMGSGEFTMELDVRFNGDPGTTQQAFISKWVEATNDRAFYFGLRNNEIVVFTSTNGSAGLAMFSEAWNPVGDTWYNISLVRDNSVSDVLRVFVDGVQLGADDGAILLDPSIDDGIAPVEIGSFNAGNDEVNGWIDNVRITRGVARYATNYTAPTEAYPTSGGTFAYDTTNMQMLFDASDTDSYPGSGTTWTDLSANAFSAEYSSGTPSFSTDGGGSLVFAGGNIPLFEVADHANLQFGATWSMVLAVKPQNGGVVNEYVIHKETNNWLVGWGFAAQKLGHMTGASWAGGTAGATMTSTLNLDEWAVLHLTRSANVIEVYINGVPHNTVGLTQTQTDTSLPFVIGGLSVGSANAFDGSISTVGVWTRLMDATEVAVQYDGIKTRLGLT